MLKRDMTKVEIERELEGKGDYVLIDNMTRFLRENPPVDIKKFVYSKLGEIYERRKMFADAANVYGIIAELSSAIDKTENLVKETKCYIQAGFFDKADLGIRKIISEVKATERAKIMISIKEFYKTQAQEYEKEKRRNRAVKTYEKLLTLNISNAEKNEINKKLSALYRELGMVREYMNIEEKL
jgi:tetratricopeptide (TPR) repeat protein